MCTFHNLFLPNIIEHITFNSSITGSNTGSSLLDLKYRAPPPFTTTFRAQQTATRAHTYVYDCSSPTAFENINRTRKNNKEICPVFLKCLEEEEKKKNKNEIMS
jgi:hypothetical protein